MDEWTSHSSPGKQIAAALAMGIVGALLMFAARDYGSLRSNAGAGFLLGLLLVVIGVLGVLFTGRQTVVIDPKRRRIAITDARFVGKKERTISFSEVTGVSIGYLGKRSNFVNTYYLVLKLRDGGEYALFAPGRYYEGASNRSVVEGWQRRLEGLLAPRP